MQCDDILFTNVHLLSGANLILHVCFFIHNLIKYLVFLVSLAGLPKGSPNTQQQQQQKAICKMNCEMLRMLKIF